jgi:hypothetical protein
MFYPTMRLRLVAMIRARILTGVADYNEYDLTDPIDRDEAERETEAIMAALFKRNTPK